ncbi:MAG: hypothetical protein DMD64_17155, partial [Gemmatimonadetes bacterium]
MWLRDHARLVRGPDGSVYYEGTVEDITNRRCADALLDLRTRQQAAVARLGQSAISSHDLGALLECAASLVTETLDVEFAQVLELRPDGSLHFSTAVGWDPEVIDTIVPTGARSHAGLTLASARPVVMDEWGAELRAQMPHYFRNHGVQSGMAVIIGTPEHPLGVLGAHTTHARKFTVDDVNFLQAIASVLAAAMARRRGEEMR